MDELPDKATYGQLYGPAMEVQTEDEAQEYFAVLVRRNARITGNSDQEATRIERINVGYFAGYYDRDTADRVYRLYGFGHPIFGTTRPTFEQGINAGRALMTLSQAVDELKPDIEAFGRAIQQGMRRVEDR
jgi:hypothetical protein